MAWKYSQRSTTSPARLLVRGFNACCDDDDGGDDDNDGDDGDDDDDNKYNPGRINPGSGVHGHSQQGASCLETTLGIISRY